MSFDNEKALLSSYQLGDLPLNNRVILAPLTRGRAGEERLANELMAEYYKQRSGAGLIISEATTVSAQGNGWVNSPGIYTDEQGRAWEKVTAAVHKAGSKIFLQLWHTGRASHSNFHNGQVPVAPSAIKIEGDEIHTPAGKASYEVPRALKTEEIPAIVADYKNAVIRAKKAGFDGVEVHSANGYLLDQFLQSKTNKRTDNYGGSLENRFRLLAQILDAISEVYPTNRIGVRLSPNGVFNDMGSPDFRETFIYAATRLNEYGLAYLHVLDGVAFGFHELGEAMTLKEIRGIFKGPLMGNCGYTEESAEAAIAHGYGDMIAFGRSYISNPDLVERFRNNWPLAEADPSTWYFSETPEKGYIDFPAYSPKPATV